MSDVLNIASARNALAARKTRANAEGPQPDVPDLFSSGLAVVPTPNQGVSLMETTPAPLPLTAYLASALTGLTDNERSLIFGLSNLFSEVCREHGIDLYEPRKRTDPILHTTVSAQDVYSWDKHSVLQSDLLIHLCHKPSTGAGEELEFAHAALLPIILI